MFNMHKVSSVQKRTEQWMRAMKKDYTFQVFHHHHHPHHHNSIEYRSVTSQKYKFVKLWDLVPFSSKASLEKGPCQKLPLNCYSQPKYKG